MTATEKLKKLIREEVRSVVRQEVKRALMEQRETKPTTFTESIEKQVRSRVIPDSLHTNEDRMTSLPKFDKSSNPYASMLNETVMSFTSKDARSFGAGVNHFIPAGEERVSTGTVNDMLSRANKSSNLDMIEIDTVPDYSGLMSKLKQNGQI
jgi:hypothetical protein